MQVAAVNMEMTPVSPQVMKSARAQAASVALLNQLPQHGVTRPFLRCGGEEFQTQTVR